MLAKGGMMEMVSAAMKSGVPAGAPSIALLQLGDSPPAPAQDHLQGTVSSEEGDAFLSSK